MSPRTFATHIKTKPTLHNCLIHAHTGVMMALSGAISLAPDRQNGLQTRCFEGTPPTFVACNGRSVHGQGRS